MMERLRTLAGNLATAFGALTPRERRLVTLAGAAAALFVVFVVTLSFLSSARTYERRTADKLRKLEQIQLLAQSFRDAERERQDVERQLSGTRMQLISFIEERGTRAGLQIPAMNPRGEVPLGDGRIIEQVVELTLTEVEVGKLHAFLTSIERGPGVVKVKSLRIEPRIATETATASATIATYRLKE